MLELTDPIGEQTGYIGIGFNNNDAYFEDKVFHKFSYPGTIDHHNPANVYNGDTLYYQYGMIDAISPTSLGVNKPSVYGIPGQSGSSFFTEDGNMLATYGVATFSNQIRHSRITAAAFHQLKQVIDTALVSSSPPLQQLQPISIYPNPFYDKAELTIDQNCSNCTLAIYAADGRLVQTTSGISGSRVLLERGELKSGIYFFQLQDDNSPIAKGKIIAN